MATYGMGDINCSKIILRGNTSIGYLAITVTVMFAIFPHILANNTAPQLLFKQNTCFVVLLVHILETLAQDHHIFYQITHFSSGK